MNLSSVNPAGGRLDGTPLSQNKDTIQNRLAELLKRNDPIRSELPQQPDSASDTVTISQAAQASAPGGSDARSLLDSLTQNRPSGAAAMVNDASNARQSSLGAIVDADMAQEAAQLAALQIRSQPAIAALSLANQAPQALLSLLR